MIFVIPEWNFRTFMIFIILLWNSMIFMIVLIFKSNSVIFKIFLILTWNYKISMICVFISSNSQFLKKVDVSHVTVIHLFIVHRLTAVSNLSLFKNLNQQHNLLQFLSARLQTDHLMAKPKGLYKIKPSLYLTLTTLTVTYTLILFPKFINSNNS